MNVEKPSPQKIVETLLTFGDTLKKTQTIDSDNLFSSNKEADTLCKEDPFAFVLACLAAGGMRAEKIWEFPWKLQQRLGHITPRHLCVEYFQGKILEAIKTKPALHRFPALMANQVFNCAKEITFVYNQKANNIWSSLDAKKIQNNFLAIKGFGPKKAAMATDLLHRFLGVDIKNLKDGNIAPDTHILRTMFRLGLIEKKKPKLAMQAAKELNWYDPGKLDFPLWTIGRKYCKAHNPKCEQCPMQQVCERKDI